MTFPLASTPPITGAFAFREYPGFGILGADIPTTGDSGRSPAINDSISPDAEYHWRIETQPSAGALTIFPDLTFEYDAAGVPDGSYPWVYRLFETGADQGTATVTQTVGNIASLVTVANSQQANTASAASIKQTHLVGVAPSQQANTASPTSIKQTHLVRIGPSTQANRASEVAIHVGLPNPDQPGAFVTNVVRKTRFDCKIQRKVIFTLGSLTVSDNFIAGDEARLTNVVTDIAGTLVDPGALTLTVKLPSGDLSLPTITRASVGNYYADLPLATGGVYLYRWSSPSPYMSAAKGELFVEQSEFA